MNDLLSKLPMFATDQANAALWRRGALVLFEARGFPKVDALHGGRPVPLVCKWYNQYLGMDKSYVQASQEDGKENWEASRSKRDKRNERKPQMDLNSRGLSTLQYMVERPHVHTSLEIVGARDFTMEQLAEKGALVEGPRDSQGDRTWTVTDAGREEIARYKDWHGGKSRRFD